MRLRLLLLRLCSDYRLACTIIYQVTAGFGKRRSPGCLRHRVQHMCLLAKIHTSASYQTPRPKGRTETRSTRTCREACNPLDLGTTATDEACVTAGRRGAVGRWLFLQHQCRLSPSLHRHKACPSTCGNKFTSLEMLFSILQSVVGPQYAEAIDPTDWRGPPSCVMVWRYQ